MSLLARSDMKRGKAHDLGGSICSSKLRVLVPSISHHHGWLQTFPLVGLFFIFYFFFIEEKEKKKLRSIRLTQK